MCSSFWCRCSIFITVFKWQIWLSHHYNFALLPPDGSRSGRKRGEGGRRRRRLIDSQKLLQIGKERKVAQKSVVSLYSRLLWRIFHFHCKTVVEQVTRSRTEICHLWKKMKRIVSLFLLRAKHFSFSFLDHSDIYVTTSATNFNILSNELLKDWNDSFFKKRKKSSTFSWLMDWLNCWMLSLESIIYILRVHRCSRVIWSLKWLIVWVTRTYEVFSAFSIYFFFFYRIWLIEEGHFRLVWNLRQFRLPLGWYFQSFLFSSHWIPHWKTIFKGSCRYRGEG